MLGDGVGGVDDGAVYIEQEAVECVAFARSGEGASAWACCHGCDTRFVYRAHLLSWVDGRGDGEQDSGKCPCKCKVECIGNDSHPEVVPKPDPGLIEGLFQSNFTVSKPAPIVIRLQEQANFQLLSSANLSSSPTITIGQIAQILFPRYTRASPSFGKRPLSVSIDVPQISENDELLNVQSGVVLNGATHIRWYAFSGCETWMSRSTRIPPSSCNCILCFPSSGMPSGDQFRDAETWTL